MARTRKSARRTAGRKNQAARTVRASRGADAVAILKHEHDETRKLFQDLAEAEGPDRRALFQRLADALAAHSEVEETLLYPEIAKVEELADAARDALEEHLIVKRLLADMLERDLEEEVFDAKCRVLEAEVLRHVEEEEAALLPRASRGACSSRSSPTRSPRTARSRSGSSTPSWRTTRRPGISRATPSRSTSW